MKPKVSIILTSYNHEKYIVEAIESVLNQTFADFELLIADDGSSDNSREVIKSFSDTRIKLFLHEENRGPRIIFQECLNFAQGKYIAIHHSDDTWTADKLEKQIKFLDAHGNYAACFTWANFIDEQSNLQELSDSDFYKTVFEQENKSRAEWLRYFFYNQNCLCHPSLMIRKYAYEKYNMSAFNGLWQLPDFYMWIKLCFYENFYIMPERLVNFRLRRNSQENTSAFSFEKLVRAETENFLIMQNFLNNFNDDKFFLEVFPETKIFVVNNEFNRNFAFAQICLKKNQPFFHLTALKILYELLRDKNSAEQIKKLYNYDEKKFFTDSGNFDIFDVAQRLSMLHAKIFCGDGSRDFVLATEKFIYVDDSANFFFKSEFISEKPIKYLRFDPDNNFISIKIDSLKICGVEQKNFTTNAAELVNDFYRFNTNTPQFIFEIENLQGKIIFEVHGKVERNYFSSSNNNSENLSENIKNLEMQVSHLKETITLLQNSNSWKITAPLRKIGDIIRK